MATKKRFKATSRSVKGGSVAFICTTIKPNATALDSQIGFFQRRRPLTIDKLQKIELEILELRQRQTRLKADIEALKQNGQ